MWIQVRSMDGKKSIRIDGLSKLTKIEALREKLVDEFEAPPETQMLFYRGKQLVDGHSLFDYNVGLNEIVQIMVRAAVTKESPRKTSKESTEKHGDKENREPNVQESPSGSTADPEELDLELLDSTYKLGDVIDARDEAMGAWFEAKITKITKAKSCDTSAQDTSAMRTATEEKVCDKKSEVVGDINANEVKDTPNEEEESLGESHKKGGSEDVEMENSGDGSSNDTTCKVEPPFKAESDGFCYHVLFEGYEDDDIVELTSEHIRPRARHKLSMDAIKPGDKVMVNYNYDEPESRGYWYDAIVHDKRNTRTIKEITCTVFIGKDLVPMKDCKVLFWYEVFAIEEAGTQLNTNGPLGCAASPAKRTNKPECDHCRDNPKKKCKHCSCNKCGAKENPAKQLLCDECDTAFHIYCLDPPLEAIPDVDEWYCPLCKNDSSEVVMAGEKLKQSKKKSKMASASSTTTRDWGKGMACVGRTKMCNIVPPNHFGPVPGVEVGMMWKFRVQASEAGAHRPHVAGIHGREDEGAYSIVLSGGYEDDTDEGDTFYYTGSGGRDLSGNKRTAEQSCDQVLTRMNKALAKNCAATIDPKKGADAGDNWKKGKPCRVIRNVKGGKHSEFAPEEGNRYDGIYKVVKYWPEKGKSGFLVWRYFLKRDDPSPAPWTKAGKKRSKELGFTMQFPEGWKEKEEEKERQKAEGKGKGKGKRKRDEMEDDEEESSPKKTPSAKKIKTAAYKVDAEIAKWIKADTVNKKLWDEALSHTHEGGQVFLGKVEELFMCICCQDIVFKPITTDCSHNICKPCLTRSFKADVFKCPACRTELNKEDDKNLNKTLGQILNGLFPGYESGR